MCAEKKFAPSKTHGVWDYEAPGYGYIDNPYFKWENLRCKHTGIYYIQEEFLRCLIELRQEFNKPMVISSGFRDRSHPREKDKPRKGAHVFGRAVDVRIRGKDAWELCGLAIKRGFRVGVSQKGSARFLHLDNMTTKDGARWGCPLWSY